MGSVTRNSSETGIADQLEASVEVDGRAAPRWHFFQQRLGANHWVSVARGPSDDIVDANGEFRATFQKPSSKFSKAAWDEELHAANASFDELVVADLVPFDR